MKLLATVALVATAWWTPAHAAAEDIVSWVFPHNAVHFHQTPLAIAVPYPRDPAHTGLYNMPVSSDTFFEAFWIRAVSIDPTDAELKTLAVARNETSVLELYRFNSSSGGALGLYFKTNCTDNSSNCGDADLRTPYGVLPVADARWHLVMVSVTSTSRRAWWTICDNLGTPTQFMSGGTGGGIDTAGCTGGEMTLVDSNGPAGLIPWGDVQSYEFGGQWTAATGVSNGLTADIAEDYIEVLTNVGPIADSTITFFRDPSTGKAPGLGSGCTTPLSSGDPNACHRGNLLHFGKGPDFGYGPVYTLLPAVQNVLPAVSDPCRYHAAGAFGCSAVSGMPPHMPLASEKAK